MSNEYKKQGYDYEGRFNSYWHQIHEVVRNSPTNGRILEVGPGNRFLANYLSERGYTAETLDIDSGLNPTYIGSTERIPCSDNTFNCVCAFEVLEHMPFEKFLPSLREMLRVSTDSVLISVPDVRWYIRLEIALASERHRIRKILSFPRLTKKQIKPAQSPKDHHWEIGREGYPLDKIIRTIKSAESAKLQTDYRIIGNPVHHMFVISKK